MLEEGPIYFAIYRLAILSPKGAYDTQHTLLILLDTKRIEIGLQMVKNELGNKANLQLTTALMAKSKFWKMD